MPFHFRFERLLAHREELEKRSLVDMARVERRRDLELRNLHLLQSEAERWSERWQRLKGSDIAMDQIRLIRGRLTALSEDVKEQRSTVEKWESQLQEARERWMEARRERKAITILKERAQEQFLANVRKAEKEHLDEVSLRPHVQRCLNRRRRRIP